MRTPITRVCQTQSCRQAVTDIEPKGKTSVEADVVQVDLSHVSLTLHLSSGMVETIAHQVGAKTSERLRKDFGKTSERLRKDFGKTSERLRKCHRKNAAEKVLAREA